MSNLPEPGAPAPAFDLPASSGENVSLASLKGSPVVLFFYPKDNTPGCTIEACNFRDLKGEFDQLGARVFGVSADSLKSHDNFISKHDLNMPLLSDSEHGMLTAYGVWGEKKNYGKTYMGITRTTVLIDAGGKIVRVWKKVKVDGHADEVLTAVRDLG
ncbi:MAG: thioredoxin-dependent thiol peroxidase [Nitrospirota bacterium]|nr:thioredoxin-dependent thiol peroxidase [Nitrospirota bacterium]